MKNKMFRGTHQQDAQEFLRCLLSQIHEEIGLVIPGGVVCGCGQKSCECHRRESAISSISHDSNTSNESTSKLVRLASGSPLTPKRKSSPSLTSNSLRKGSYSKLRWSSKSSLVGQQGDVGVKEESGSASKVGVTSEGCVQWEAGDVFVVDLDTRVVSHHSLHSSATSGLESTAGKDKRLSNTAQTGSDTSQSEPDKDQTKSVSNVHIEPVVKVRGQERATPTTTNDGTSVDPTADKVVLREKPEKKKGELFTLSYLVHPHHTHPPTHTRTHTHPHREAAGYEHCESGV